MALSKRGLISGAVVGILIAGGAALAVHRADSPGTDSQRFADVPPPIGDGPCADAESVPIDAMSSQLPFVPDVLPHDELASHDNVSGAWSCASGHAAVITFASHIEMTMDSGWTVTDDKAKLDHFSADWPGSTETTLGGRPALVVPIGSDSSRGEVMFFDQGSLVRIDGDGSQSIDELSRVAASVS